jgi:hypothetical protein
MHLLLRAERWHHVIFVPFGPHGRHYFCFVLLHEILDIILIEYALSIVSYAAIAS